MIPCVNRPIGGFAIYLIYNILVVLFCVNSVSPLDKANFVLYLCIDILINQEC